MFLLTWPNLNHPRRYEYWPSQLKSLPILYQIILCARGSLNASSVEMLVLGHHYILRELLSSKARIASQLATGVDPQQIEDEFEERMQGIFLAIAAADDSDSD